MFVGEYRHQIDEKGRVRIPSKLKEMLGENPFITRGPQHCLLVFPRDEAEKKLTEKFAATDFADVKGNKALKLLTSSGFYAEEDKQGRILLPSNLIKHSQIQKNIVTIGALNWVEIWSEENWDIYSDVSADEFDNCLMEIPKKEE